MKKFIMTETELAARDRLFFGLGAASAIARTLASSPDPEQQSKTIEKLPEPTKEVPAWATHFALVRTDTDGHSGFWYVLDRCQEI